MRPRETAPRTYGRWDVWTPLLNNRLVLSGLAVVMVLLLIAIVLVSIGHGSDQGSPHTVLARSTQSADSTPLPRGSLSARVITTASLRNGPSVTYAILGTIPQGATVAAIGRSSDQSWIQVRYPPGSDLKGWVDAQFLDVAGDVSQLVVAGPGPTPVVEVPEGSQEPPTPIIITREPPTDTPVEETPEATSTSTPELKPTPTGKPKRTATSTPTAIETPSD